MKIVIAFLAAVLCAVGASGAWAQSTVRPMAIVVTACGTAPSSLYVAGSQQFIVMDVNGNLCTNVTVTATATITGFTPVTTGTPIAVTTGGVTGTLPAGTVVVASNVGATNGAYCKLGASATTSDQLIPPNSWFAFTVGGATQLTCITGASTTTVNMVGGSGIPTGSGGGGGGGGSGGAVTIADGADTTLGAKADAKSPATDTTPITIMAVLKQVSASVQAIATSIAGTLTATVTNAGTFLVQAAQSGTWTVQPGNTPNTTPWLATPAPGAAGGVSTLSAIVPNNTTSVALKASAGQLYDLDGFSISAATPVWIKFYDAAQGSTTCGSGTPKLRYMVAGTGTTGTGTEKEFHFGVPFATAITYCVTAGIADNDTTAPAASTYVVNFGYK